jgi:hypothetical protein
VPWTAEAGGRLLDLSATAENIFCDFWNFFAAADFAASDSNFWQACRWLPRGSSVVMGEGLGQAIGERCAECRFLFGISAAGMMKGFAVVQD